MPSDHAAQRRQARAARLRKGSAQRLLLGRGLVEFEAKSRDRRKRVWRLSQWGARIHDQILVHALEARWKMTRDISVEDQAA